MVSNTVVIILNCTGCLKYNIYVNSRETTLKFQDFTQQERKKYICDFLKQKYDLECQVSGDVDKKFDGLFLMKKIFLQQRKLLIIKLFLYGFPMMEK